MDQKQQILHHYRVDEDGLREISRKVGVDRKTVRRLIQAFEERLTKDPDLGMEEFLAERPKYKKREYCPRTLTHEITKEIDKWLKENERRRSMGVRKQCLKRQDIHRQLIEKGMNVSYSSVCSTSPARNPKRQIRLRRPICASTVSPDWNASLIGARSSCA